MIGIFSFFAGAGFLDLGFETTGYYKTLFVNEFKDSFNHIYQYSRERMGIPSPTYGHHVGDVAVWLDDKEENEPQHMARKLKNIIFAV